MADVSRLKEIKSELEGFQSGVGRFEMGMPAGWHYPMLYKSDEIPPVLEKERMIYALTGQQPATTVSISDEDRAIIKKKQDTIDQASFDAWLLDQYRPWEHPAFKAYFLQKYPHFQEKMEEAIKKKAEFQLKAQIEALKDTPEGDMFRFEMTKHPEMQKLLTDPLGPEQRVDQTGRPNLVNPSMVHTSGEFTRGLLNPWKLRDIDKLENIAAMAATARPEPQLAPVGIAHRNYGTSAWGFNAGHFNGRPDDAFHFTADANVASTVNHNPGPQGRVAAPAYPRPW